VGGALTDLAAVTKAGGFGTAETFASVIRFLRPRRARQR
jgi:hypothetical protein